MLVAKLKINFRKLLLGSLIFILVCPSQIFGATFGTVGINTGCSYPCDGYYANHFNAQIIATSVSGINYYRTSQFRATMTQANQNGDRWTILSLMVYSEGGRLFTDTSKASTYSTASYSSYWMPINRSVLLAKGNNRTEFQMKYSLKNTSGTIVETWYPIRRSSNIQ
ncbi:hypothetical protein ABE096_11125 [Robertmurraya massiliosenegalensis]|uniref:hypothetical protein n=1 Tax=Robertmurraya TaxID=2837507 RepID=UPI0039A742DD